MEQYLMPKELDMENLRKCIDNHEADFLHIRDCGGYNEDGSYRMQGLTKVNEKLEGRNLDFRKDNNGLYMLIDSSEIFHFPLQDYVKGFSLAYERIKPTDDGVGRVITLGIGIDPYDPNLPEPRRSFLRTILDSHMMEIFFKGRIPLEFHSWRDEKSEWKYWTIAEEQ